MNKFCIALLSFLICAPAMAQIDQVQIISIDGTASVSEKGSLRLLHVNDHVASTSVLLLDKNSSLRIAAEPFGDYKPVSLPRLSLTVTATSFRLDTIRFEREQTAFSKILHFFYESFLRKENEEPEELARHRGPGDPPNILILPSDSDVILERTKLRFIWNNGISNGKFVLYTNAPQNQFCPMLDPKDTIVKPNDPRIKGYLDHCSPDSIYGWSYTASLQQIYFLNFTMATEKQKKETKTALDKIKTEWQAKDPELSVILCAAYLENHKMYTSAYDILLKGQYDYPGSSLLLRYYRKFVERNKVRNRIH